MIGAMFKLGEQKIRPGVYVRWYNDGADNKFSRPLGVAAALVKADWGPVGKLFTIKNEEETKTFLGTGDGADVVNEIFRGGASIVHVVRIGTEGKPATASLVVDSAGSLKLSTIYPTTRKFTVTIRESLDATKKELLVFEENQLVESITFDAGGNEAAALVEKILVKSKFLTASSTDTGIIKLVVNEKMIDGTNPATVAGDYTEALKLTETAFFDSIAVDSEDPVIHAALHAFVRRKIQEGYRMTLVVGEKPTVDFETRKSHARSFNDFTAHYVGNGVETENGQVTGAKAAARVLGMLVSGSYKTSLTRKPITGGVGIVGEMTAKEYNEAAENGMIVFSMNPEGIPQIDYGINTLITLGEDEDEGWKKIRRVRTRFELIDRITVMIAKAMSNDVNNNNDGQQFIITLSNGIIGEMIREGGLESGEMIVDPNYKAEGDSAGFKFDNLVDLDGLEKAYLAFGFRY